MLFTIEVCLQGGWVKKGSKLCLESTWMILYWALKKEMGDLVCNSQLFKSIFWAREKIAHFSLLFVNDDSLFWSVFMKPMITISILTKSILKTSCFHFKGWKIQIFSDFWQLFLFLLSKVIQTGFFCLQVIFQSSCNQGKWFWMTFESKNRKSCQNSAKIWIFHPLKWK